MAIIEREAALVTKVGSDQVLLLPYTNIANVEGGVASVNGITPDTSGAVTMPVATATVASTVRLYSTSGDATDGALTQAATTAALNTKLDATATAVQATADADGNVITSTYATKDELSATGEAAVEVAQEYTDAQIAANAYTLPAATTTIMGGVKVGSNINVDNSVISVTDGTTTAKGVVQLSSATNSTSNTLAATASAVKAAYDLANSKQAPATTIAGYGITDAYTKTEVDTKVSGLVDSAPETLNTLNELAAALGDDPNFATTVSTEIGKKANTADLSAVAFSNNYEDLDNTPASLPDDGGNADTVNGLTVLTAVPANAKFTDTVYTHPTHTAKTNGFYKITVDELGHVSATTAVAKADITDLGIPAQDTTYSVATTAKEGLMSVTDKTKLDSIATGANAYTHPSYPTHSSGLYKITVDDLGHVSATSAVVKADITDLGIPAQDTTYETATATTAGLLSAADKKKLDGIADGATNESYVLPTASKDTLGGVKTTSDVTTTTGLTACPIIGGVPYYKDTDTEYTLSSFGITATAAELNALDGITATVTELNYIDGVTSNIQNQLDGKLSTTGTAAKATADADGNNIVDTYATKTAVANDIESAISVAQEYADTQITENAYTLPTATTSVLGGVKVGTNITVTAGTISVADGTTSAKGVVQLSSATNSTSTTVAATASAVKAAYDLANSKQSPATTIAGYGITDAYTKTEVDTKVSGLVDSAPETLNTLNELAAALGDDPNFATTVSTEIGKKANTADLADVAFSGAYSDLSGVPTSLPADGGNADTVNGLTVLTAVPANAKFTDTTYSTGSASAAGITKLYTATGTSTDGTLTQKAITDALATKLGTSDTAASAAKLSVNGGSVTQPIYFNNGVPTPCTYALNATVPADAKFTDTVYTLPTASSTVLGGVKTTSSVTTTTGLTACPIIGGVPYYENTTYTLSSFGITATAAELNALDGITATVTELNYCDGVTSSIQTQLDGKLSTTGKAVSATVADSANAVAWTNVTGKPTIPAVTKVTFTATDSRWGTVSNGKYPLTIAASGGEFLNCYRTNGSVYDKVDVSVTVSGTNIIIYSLDKFAGYMTYIG